MIAFLMLSDDVIRDLLYIREFAMRPLFFRRLRVPPLIFPYWDRIVISPIFRHMFRSMVADHVGCLTEAKIALQKLDAMRHLARRSGIPDQGLDLQYDTFAILVLVRAYFFADPSESAAIGAWLLSRRNAYRRKWRPRYALKFNFGPSSKYWVHFFWLKRALIRNHPAYRLLDNVITLRLLALIYPLLGRWRQRLVPKFARKQAMGIDSLFK
jgi:hypothetical protein